MISRAQFNALTLYEKMGALFDMIAGIPDPVDVSKMPAYDRPEMMSTDPRLIVDGQTRNMDGSIWQRTPEIPGRQLGGNVKIVHGYISPIKHPALWDLARHVYGAEFPDRFENPWMADPYMTYTGNPEVLLRQGYKKEQINFMMFGSICQPTGLSVKQ